MDSVLTVSLQVREQESQGPQRKLLREPGLEPRLVHLTLDNFDCVSGNFTVIKCVWRRQDH